jgi:formylmethanofuran dehydrogenase subunit E
LLNRLKREQYNRTDPDATLMSKPAHNLMAYNAQIAVDNCYKFIIATDITSEGSDKKELHRMAKQAQEAVGNESVTITADKGYYSTVEIKQCIDDNLNVIVPPTQTGQEQRNKGKFGKEQFIYNKEQDGYICPNNQTIPKSHSNHTSYAKTMHIYRTSSKVCKACPLQTQCLGEKTKHKQIQRWEHQQLIDEYHAKMKTETSKALIKKRASIVEHPFGTIKRMLGWDHYLVRGKEKVSGENALIMFAYNFKRLLNLIGVPLFKKLVKAIKTGDIEAIKQEIAEHIAAFLAYLARFLLYLLAGKKWACIG